MASGSKVFSRLISTSRSVRKAMAEPVVASSPWAGEMLNTPLAKVDPVIFDIIEHEKNRQWKGIQLIPSENFGSMAVMEAVMKLERLISGGNREVGWRLFG